MFVCFKRKTSFFHHSAETVEIQLLDYIRIGLTHVEIALHGPR